jgi:aryl-alcohol dehydrogenase-like predicted oxidoreductase
VHHRNLEHHTHVVPLPGTTRADHALQNIAAAELVLTPAELRALEAALSGT